MEVTYPGRKKVRMHSIYVLMVLMYGSEVRSITKSLARWHCATDTLCYWHMVSLWNPSDHVYQTHQVTLCYWHMVSPWNPSDHVYQTHHQLYCQADYLQFLTLSEREVSAFFGMWHVQTLNRIIIGSLRHHSNHPVTGGDLVDTLVPPGWGRLILLYSQSTSGSTQPGERPATVCSGDVSSTRKCSIMEHATEERRVADYWLWMYETWHKTINPFHLLCTTRHCGTRFFSAEFWHNTIYNIDPVEKVYNCT